ncbi:hypothetical protein LINGRAHAP2_LOCUS4690 [Linum grandiflorum]
MGLETCTEGIGSESGHDGGFSSYTSPPPPHVRYPVEYYDDEVTEENGAPDRLLLANMGNFSIGGRKSSDEKESVARPLSFPPPISTLAGGEVTRRSFQMRRYWKDGRLIMEVVPHQDDDRSGAGF